MNNNSDEDTDLAAVKHCIVAFEDARAALDEHYRWCDKAFKGAHNEHGVEARKRLNQLIWFLQQMEPLLAEAAVLREKTTLPCPPPSLNEEEIGDWIMFMHTPEVMDAHRRQTKLIEPIETLTEAFYWFAGRARSVIRLLPELENFETEGVRNVRNQLIEHPEKKQSGVLITSFSYGGPQGPVVKALRYDHQAALWPDRGLFVNALEFALNLERRIKLAGIQNS